MFVKLSLVTFFLLLFVSGCIAPSYRIPNPWLELYEHQCEEVSELLIYDLHPPKSLLLSVNDENAIVQFLKTIQFNKQELSDFTLVNSPAFLEFILVEPSGVTHSFELGDGASFLRSRCALWTGDAELTEASAARLKAWLVGHGIDPAGFNQR